MHTLPRSTPVLVTGLALLILLTTTGGAVAGSLITSKQIKNGTITSVDIKDGGIAVKDLAKSARGIAGPKGATGGAGPRGLSAWDVIPSGVTVTGELVYDSVRTGRRRRTT